MRDMAVEAKINDDFDREIDRATEVFDAESEFRRNRNPNKLNSINQTIDYDLWKRERVGDVAHAMDWDDDDSPDSSLQTASRRGRSFSSASPVQKTLQVVQAVLLHHLWVRVLRCRVESSVQWQPEVEEYGKSRSLAVGHFRERVNWWAVSWIQG
jgi:hypothetical protein